MPETSTFLLCGKKYMISMEDVASLTGLCIDGDAIVWKEEKNVLALCKKVLGKEPPKAAGGAINYSWYCCTPNNTGAKVDAVYLTFLQNDEDFQDFEHIRKYSWGSAMLALLIDNLKKEPSKKGVVNLAGSAALLEVNLCWLIV
ncbi:hypothetical protein RHGRI_008632 [Rhododendron griersonianum]|uniref:Aminotransferase-like plant mobile domain-containing protein n=1 Tax=Rhododendron griersonianum TaxID=479676 RepID=A0AAV6L2N9_9ERIC|nr:hypothetical protein RHGRI_008632 [Rhododendron griersonianum]